jgi:uncharacterized SAM-binding protein YcdF (DUF218 family)
MPWYSPKRFYPLDRLAGCLFLSLSIFLGYWLQWGDWPNTANSPQIEKADLIVALGGGAQERPRQTATLYFQGIAPKILVTGDGNTIYNALIQQGIPREAILHETQAHSTWENALFVGPIPVFQKAQRVVLVTSWFHGSRALAVFKKQFPGKTFFVASEPAIYPLTPWDKEFRRRERYATLYYKLFYGILPGR